MNMTEQNSAHDANDKLRRMNDEGADIAGGTALGHLAGDPVLRYTGRVMDLDCSTNACTIYSGVIFQSLPRI